jgi:hypothetical protein
MKRHIILLSGVILLAMIASVALGASPRGLADALAAANAPAGLPPVQGAPRPSVAESPVSAETPQAAAPAGPMRLPKSTLHPGAFYIDWNYPLGSDLSYPDPKTYPVQGAFAHIKWSQLQGASGFNWTQLHYWINTRVSQGLNTGIMIDPYDGYYDGDSLAIPDSVIKTAGTMVVVPADFTVPGSNPPRYVGFRNYFRNQWNGSFDYNPPNANNWVIAGTAKLTNAVPDSGDGWAAQLAGSDNATGSLTTWGMRIPAMPPELTSDKMRLSFSVAMTTTDPLSDADHLYIDIIDQSNGNAVTTLADITNTSMVSNTWRTVEAPDVSNFVGRWLQFRIRAITDGANPTTFYVDNVTLNVRMLIPKYWGTPYKSAYSAFVQALGQEFKNDPGLDFVAIGMGLSGETQPSNGDLYNSILSSPPNSLNSAMWIDTVNRFTDYYVSAFSTGTTLQKSLLIQYAPYYSSPQERTAVTDYATGAGTGLSHNGLLPDWIGAVDDNTGVGVYDPIIPPGMTIPRYLTRPIAFESYPFYLCSPVAAYWGLLSALDKHTDYMRIDMGLLTGSYGATNKPFFDWAKNYWGRTLDDTPSVWTVMREHRNPMEMCHAPTSPYYATGSSQSYPRWATITSGLPRTT